MKFRFLLITVVICLVAVPAFGYSNPLSHRYTGATIFVPAKLTVKPLLVISVNGVYARSNEWFPGDVLSHTFYKDVTPRPRHDATYAKSRDYRVWVYSNAPWAARIGRTAYAVRTSDGFKLEDQISQEKRLGFEYRKTDGSWQPLNVWSLTPIWDSPEPTGNDGQVLGEYQFRGVVDSKTTPGKYEFAVYFTAYQE